MLKILVLRVKRFEPHSPRRVLSHIVDTPLDLPFVPRRVGFGRQVRGAVVLVVPFESGGAETIGETFKNDPRNNRGQGNRNDRGQRKLSGTEHHPSCLQWIFAFQDRE